MVIRLKYNADHGLGGLENGTRLVKTGTREKSQFILRLCRRGMV